MEKQDQLDGVTIDNHQTDIEVTQDELEEVVDAMVPEDGVITLSTDDMTDEEILQAMNEVAKDFNNLKNVKKDDKKDNDVMEITEI